MRENWLLHDIPPGYSYSTIAHNNYIGDEFFLWLIEMVTTSAPAPHAPAQRPFYFNFNSIFVTAVRQNFGFQFLEQSTKLPICYFILVMSNSRSVTIDISTQDPADCAKNDTSFLVPNVCFDTNGVCIMPTTPTAVWPRSTPQITYN